MSDHKGSVYCYFPERGERGEMACGGFESARKTIKKLCPTKHYGLVCKGCDKCPVNHGMRIPSDTDRRIFTPIDRASYKWERQYNKRTSGERGNARLDECLGYEKHCVRGINKM